MSARQPASASRAVFLSYAREDTDAARREADALRAFGVEVWFDQLELRGGDGRDAKIRKQISECGLLMPVIAEALRGHGVGVWSDQDELRSRSLRQKSPWNPSRRARRRYHWPSLGFWRTPLSTGCAALLLLCTAGCTAINPTAAGSFSTGVTAVRAQTTAAFGAVTTITRAAAVDYAASSGELNDDELEGMPSAAAVAAWNRALDPVERYAQHLSALATGGPTDAVESAVGDLAKQFNATSSELSDKFKLGGGRQIAARPAGTLAEAAGGFLRARSAAQASVIAAKADPQIRQILATLAEAIGANSESGMRQKIGDHWKLHLSDLRREFRTATTPEQRKAIIEKYIALLDQRDAQDRQLAMLRDSYLTLADAHTAFARGSESDLRSAVDFVTNELRHAQDLQTQFAKTLGH